MSSGRALLTDNERKVISGDKSVNYQSTVRANFRNRLDRLHEDIEILRANDPELFAEYIAVASQHTFENPTYEGVHHGDLDFSIYKNGKIWEQSYYNWAELGWGPASAKTARVNTAEILIKEAIVEDMPVTINARLEFVSHFGLESDYEWEFEAAEIREWYLKEIVLD